jgi:TDG/mug DNA glycosylase family protein
MQLVREFRPEVRTPRARSSLRTLQRGGISADAARPAHGSSPVRQTSRPALGCTSRPDGSLAFRDKHGRILPLSDEPGHRITADWMGNTVLTLEDLLRPGLWAVAVGINPASVSVARGHYYQGRLGRRFLARLRQAGFIDDADDGYEDDAAFAAGIGFTDIIKRPTTSAKELRASEYAHGRDLLAKNVERYCPELLVFAFKGAAEALFDPFQGNGFVPGLRLGPSEVFVMPGPMESDVTAQPTLAALAERVRGRQLASRAHGWLARSRER